MDVTKTMIAVKKPIEITVWEVYGTGIIETLEGELKFDGRLDYIITGITGERYPIKKDIFDKTYDVVRVV